MGDARLREVTLKQEIHGKGECIVGYQVKENPKGGRDVLISPRESRIAKKAKEHRGTWKIQEALQLLNEAAEEKKEVLGHLLAEKYSHVREVMYEATESYREVVQEKRQSFNEAVADGKERIQELTTDIDKRVHNNPWLFLGMVAVGFFLSGYMMSGSMRSEIKYRC